MASHGVALRSLEILVWRGVARENWRDFWEIEPIWTQLQRKYSGGLVSKGGVCVCFFLVGKIFAYQLFAYHFCLRTKFFHVVEAFTYRIVLGNESQTHGSG